MPNATHAPSKLEMMDKKIKVAIFPFDHNEIEVAKNINLGIALANKVESEASAIELVELIDRNAALKLKNEINLSENSKLGSYKGPQVADYIVTGSISSASFKSNFNRGNIYYKAITVALTSGLVVGRPRYDYESEIIGNLKIYKIPSLQLIRNIEFKSKIKTSEDANEEIGLLYERKITSKARERDDGLLVRAANDAIEKISNEIKDLFIPPETYIIEKKTLKNNSIFKISIGKKYGLTQNDIVKVVEKYEFKNPLSGEIETEERIIAKGKVSDQIGNKYAWIVLDDEKNNYKIKLGHLVRITHNNL